jgi:hypothetical protein
MKILVLIIAGGEKYSKQYAEMEAIWLKYMFLMPKMFECYFVKNTPELDSEIYVDVNTIWVRGEENMVPGILTKTVFAIEHALANMHFDYLVRTNMSSVLNLPLLHNLLAGLPHPVHYFGSNNGGYIEGSCMVLSRLACQYLCEHVDLGTDIIDDVTIGKTLHPHFPITHYPKRDVLMYEQLHTLTSTDLNYYFHYRCKSYEHQETTHIMRNIVNMLYHV